MPRISGFQGHEEGVPNEVSIHCLSSRTGTPSFQQHKKSVCKVSINGLSSIVLGSLAARYSRRSHIVYYTRRPVFADSTVAPGPLASRHKKGIHKKARTGARNIKRCQYSLAELQNQDRQLPWTGEGKRKEVSIHWLNWAIVIYHSGHKEGIHKELDTFKLIFLTPPSFWVTKR